MKHTFIFKVIKREPVIIEGVFHINAKTKRKARKILKKYGDYEILSFEKEDFI